MSERTKLPVQPRLKSSGLSIGDLAGRAGVRASAIRYYEACGLIPAPARRSGRRFYDRDAVERLRLILSARELGFSIREIRHLSSLDIGSQRAAAEARASSLRVLSDEIESTAVRLDELSGCECARPGAACRL